MGMIAIFRRRNKDDAEGEAADASADDNPIPEKHRSTLDAPEEFSGPVPRRFCTDVLCLLLIYAMWAAMTALGVYSMTEGDYRVVLYPMDYDGNICGTDHGSIDMSEYKYLYYINSYMNGVCVKECPTFNTTNGDYGDAYTLVTYGGIWQVDGKSTIPADYIQVADYSSSDNVRYCTSDLCYPDDDPLYSFKSQGINEGYGYAFYAMDTTESMYRCYPTDDSVEYINNVTMNTDDDRLTFDDALSIWSKLYADLWTAQEYILGFGFCVALVLSFVYAFLMRIKVIINLMVWGSIATTFVFVFGMAGYFTYIYNEWSEEDPPTHSKSEIDWRLAGAIILYFFGMIMFCLTCFFRKQIILAVRCTEAASRAISSMFIIIFLPVLQALGTIVFMVMFMVYSVYVASMGTYETVTESFNGYALSYRSWEYGDFVVGSAWYMLFCFFVTVQFIVAVGSIAISYAVCTWYFTRNKDEIGQRTVFKSLRISLCHHQGTAAFGSFVIGLVQIIRQIIGFIQGKVKDADNKCAEGVLCCCQCCFWCFENIMKYISKNAYIQTALFGYSFCKATKESFFLIMRNAARVSAMEYVSQTLTIVGRLLIVAATVCSSYLLMEYQIEDQVNSLWGPMFLTGALAYYVADMFMDLFDMAVLAILQCVIADEEMFDGDDVYADGELKEWLDKWDAVDSSKD